MGTPGLDNESCGSTNTLSFTNDILPILNANSCTGCHGRLSNLTTILATMSGDDRSSNSGANMPWITPGDPTNSYVYQKVNGTASFGSQMGSLNSTDLSSIEQWIIQGAQQ